MSVSILIVEAPYYTEIVEELVKGATSALEEAGASYERVSVPGALEIPGAIILAEESGLYDGYVALGCVIRGETSHYDIVAGESARGLMMLTMEAVAVGNGILTCENVEQAMVRAATDGRNKGGEAVRAALAMISLRDRLVGQS